MLDDINDDVDLYINMLLDDNKYNKILNSAQESVYAGEAIAGEAMHARFFTGAGTPLIGEAQAGTKKNICCVEDGARTEDELRKINNSIGNIESLLNRAKDLVLELDNYSPYINEFTPKSTIKTLRHFMLK